MLRSMALRAARSIWPIAVLAATAPLGRATASPAPQQPMIVNAAFSHVDYQTGTATFTDITVVQGDTRLTAERGQATGLSLGNGSWTFGGNVSINVQPRGTLRSDHAVVQIRDDRITVATFTGHPALFEQQRSQSSAEVHGRADNIVFEASADTAHLSGEPSISDGHNEISAPLLVYNFRDGTMQAASPGGRRVHIAFSPPPAQGSARRQPPARKGKRRPPS